MHGSSKLSLPTGVCICKCPEAASKRGLQVVGQGFGTCRPSCLSKSVCSGPMYRSTWLHAQVCFRPPQARLINRAVSVRSALSGVQPASQLSGKVTAAKPNRAKLIIAGSSENMETCLTPTRNYPVKGHQIIWFSPAPPTTSYYQLPTEGHNVDSRHKCLYMYVWQSICWMVIRRAGSDLLTNPFFTTA